ncbi:MAG: hypothetical protein NTW21_27325 [Verrucomicrobia bacterium]|nr:hypothetical protein [Verrucomicrobiota bacterium]
MKEALPALVSGVSISGRNATRTAKLPIDSSDVANADGGDGSDIGAYEMNPSAQMSIFTAVEVKFDTTLGHTYRVESSTDMVGRTSFRHSCAISSNSPWRTIVRIWPWKIPLKSSIPTCVGASMPIFLFIVLVGLKRLFDKQTGSVHRPINQHYFLLTFTISPFQGL